MSETDDTDILLLIPPNFFLVPSSGSEGSLLDSSRTVVHKPSCTAQVLGKLVNQVHSLENRLESLELSTNESISSFGGRRKSCETESFDSRSLDRKCFTFPRRRRRKVLNKRYRKRDWSLTSLDSVTTTHIPPLRVKDFPDKSSANDTTSMDGDISSIVSTPSKKNDKLLLHEIDEFLTKVESYEIPDSKIKNETSLSPENVIRATGDYMTKKMDPKMGVDDIKLPSGRIVSSNILDKYIYLVKNNTEATDNPTSSNVRSQYVAGANEKLASESQKCSSLKNETKSPSSRKLNFMDSKEIQVTSTPKKPQPYSDTFRPSSNKIYDRASKVLEQYKSKNFGSNSQNSMADTSHSLSPKKDEFKMPQMRPFPEGKDGFKLSEFRNKYIDTIDTDLLSLSEMWGEKRDKGDRMENAKLEEEKLKREHCEAIIQQLQKKILEQQEKLAVAVKVDHSKDQAISKLREAWLKLTSSLDRAEERHKAALDKMMREVDNFKAVADEAQKKTSHFESELYKALDLAHDYQDKCKQLNLEMKQVRASTESALASKDQVLASKDKEIQALKENYETVMRLNKQSTDCVKNLEDVLEKEKSEHSETKQKLDELSRRLQSIDEETALVHQEKELLRTKLNEERGRAAVLERQLADKQDQCSDLLNKCDYLDAEVKSLRKQLELQKNELKSHYQKQLEDAVLAKLQEFQQQLEHAERDLESDARGKESAMLETFNRQVARIEEQHKLEINVLEEKQKEEIKLYRLQLAQASEKIGLLESKLESHRRRRGQIATQLHGVMQQQWRQAVRILTSGQETQDHTRDSGSASTPAPDFAGKVPPLSLPPRRDRDPLNFDGLSDHELQHYVKLYATCPGPELISFRSDPQSSECRPPDEPTDTRGFFHPKAATIPLTF
ncbi:repetitive organellar protein isoform X2 [Cydia pomonella]|uniref:repetitive organellar protein isoform X2 n=1 Tax=Cydia pomonella TaxID=82600 RepID=UPI002ADD4A39|nr:repetitive organellar protein isoform X2 [Cydia pomonella]